MGKETYPPNQNTKSGFSFFKINIDLIIEKKIFLYATNFFKIFFPEGVSVSKIYLSFLLIIQCQ